MTYRLILALICITCLVAPVEAQQISITSPSAGTKVTPGETVTVQVSASPSAFSAVQLIAGPQIAITPPLQQPPYVFSITIPNDLVGTVNLTALGTVSSQNHVFSAPVPLDSEMSAAIVSLSTDIHYYEFPYVGAQDRILLSGTFSNGTVASLNGSSLVSYSSGNSGVATVNATGVVTAVGPGTTVITVTYGAQSLGITVSVFNAIRGDLNGDGRIDQDDLNIILAALNTTAVSPNDGRDLNHDGVINALDARILTTLCTYARCVTYQ